MEQQQLIMIMHLLVKSVELAKVLAVLGPMKVVPLLHQFVQNMDTVNAALTNQEDQLVDLASAKLMYLKYLNIYKLSTNRYMFEHKVFWEIYSMCACACCVHLSFLKIENVELKVVVTLIFWFHLHSYGRLKK